MGATKAHIVPSTSDNQQLQVSIKPKAACYNMLYVHMILVIGIIGKDDEYCILFNVRRIILMRKILLIQLNLSMFYPSNNLFYVYRTYINALTHFLIHNVYWLFQQQWPQ